MLTIKRLIQAFPLNTLLLVSTQARNPKNNRVFDVIRVTKKSWELLGSCNGNWVKKARETRDKKGRTAVADSGIIESVYNESPVYDEYYQGSITARLFYKEDKKLLKSWKFISPKLKQYLAKDFK
jgi:hypothetical protein